MPEDRIDLAAAIEDMKKPGVTAKESNSASVVHCAVSLPFPCDPMSAPSHLQTDG
jgi:hypothetical protein